jgi:hypothetical protein
LNLSFDATADALRTHCASVGEIVSADLLTRGKNQRAAGTEGTELDGRRLQVRAYFRK